MAALRRLSKEACGHKKRDKSPFFAFCKVCIELTQLLRLEVSEHYLEVANLATLLGSFQVLMPG